MSSMSITNRRQIWSNQHPLRKQRSLIDNNNGVGYLNNNNSIVNSQRTTATFSLLQKQFSVDKIYNSRFNNNNNNNSNSNCSSANGRSLTRQDHRYDVIRGNGNNNNNNNRLINGFNKNRTNSGQSTTTFGSGKDSTDLSVYLTSKKKTVQIGYGDKKERNIGSDRLCRKSSKGGGDDKVNLNIFLGQSVTETDNDDDSSDDVDSSTESQIEIIKSNPRPKTIEKLPPTPSANIIKPTIRKPLSAASRRAQFQANRNNSINLSTTSIISAAPSLTISSRPPLVRAMSAPIRTLDENSKYILANKRKSRRRKILGRQLSTTCDKTSPTTNNKLIDNNSELVNNNNNNENNNNENNENLNDKNRVIGKQNNNNNNKTYNRSRPELGCDVVTLVSLISSEGSDSEKEEILPTKIVVAASPIKRAPTLRKTGKSVSFQEHDVPNFTTATKEFPHMLRRGSVAPLAARIRANRPPTAPPVSIFIADFENSHTKMSEKIKSSSKEDLSTITTKTLTRQSDSKDCPDDDNSGDNQFPEYARTIKERECWKLFQKMSNKGVSVSYDTILRGMLTPTELRHLQKQREHEEALKAKQQKQAEEAQLNDQLKK